MSLTSFTHAELEAGFLVHYDTQQACSDGLPYFLWLWFCLTGPALAMLQQRWGSQHRAKCVPGSHTHDADAPLLFAWY